MLGSLSDDVVAEAGAHRLTSRLRLQAGTAFSETASVPLVMSSAAAAPVQSKFQSFLNHPAGASIRKGAMQTIAPTLPPRRLADLVLVIDRSQVSSLVFYCDNSRALIILGFEGPYSFGLPRSNGPCRSPTRTLQC